MHLQHLRQVFEVMRESKLYANLKKWIFCAPDIPVLGNYVSTEGVRADTEKIEAIRAWPVPQDQKQLRQWLGLVASTQRTLRQRSVRCRSFSKQTSRGRGVRAPYGIRRGDDKLVHRPCPS
ncbi:hypothetical protein PF003_g21049 [Phytophthora fragariae]|nr:hypothetical protein PF003_g21049 [Phytophthora fragariae]